VITRFGRSAGYGFVTFESASSVPKALALKETELEGRPINVEQATQISSESRPRRSRGRGRGVRGGSFRGRRTRREPPTGEPSKNVLFVGNLPFNVIDDDLVNIFAKFTLDSARVIRRYDGASRGFGFVTLATEDQQKKALESLADVWCDDRKLVIRPAISEEHKAKPEEVAATE